LIHATVTADVAIQRSLTMPHNIDVAAPTSHDPSEAEGRHASRFALRGRMGTFGLLTTVLAFTAPLGVVFGFVSVNISFGIGVPIAFIAVAILMALFAFGFTSMTKAIPRPGAFYTYIREGLGRPMGLGGSLLALGTYGFNITSCIVVSGIAVNNLVSAFAGGTVIPWWVWSAVMLAVAWTLSYFNVELSAKVLATVLVIEVVAVTIFDVVVIANGGPEGQSFEPWNPANLITPTIGVLLLFSIGVFNGFEATAIYRDEVRRPEVTIPRATYLAIAFLGVFYAISAYALILSVGASNAVEVAQTDAPAMMPNALLTYFGMFANQLVSILLVTSFFASMLSLQNILSRYTHSLAVDGIFPRQLAAVHDKH
jgi:amino acid transporter